MAGSLTVDRELTDLAEFRRWWAECQRSCRTSVTRVPLTELNQWRFDGVTGNLRHSSGQFFTVEGLQVQAAGRVRLSRPVINQPEIGILGILVREIDGVPYCLMQAKMEPGNINTLQLSPTVQATRSNYTQVHRGRPTPYLEHFVGDTRGEVLTDVLQSEQGAWFWRKRNRNMVVRVTGDVAGHDGFRWLSLPLIHQLMRIDNLVNMDARTVLSCMPATCTGEDKDEREALHPMSAVLSWFTEAKTWCDWSARLVPLADVTGWTVTRTEIADVHERDFRIAGFQIEADNREVARWSQPLLQPRGTGLAVLVVRKIDGVPHVLLQARAEYGLLDMVEMAPTCQVLPGADRPPAGDRSQRGAATPDTTGRTRYEAVLSEEGGRFYHALTRYRIVEVGADYPVDVPRSFCWVTPAQLRQLLRHGHYLNIEARTLVACLRSIR